MAGNTPFPLTSDASQFWNLNVDSNGKLSFNANSQSAGNTRMVIDDDRDLVHIGTGLAGGDRPWMRTGVHVSWNTDNVYLGLKDQGVDRKDTVLAWGDNTNDAFRIIFALSGGAVDGKEIMRLLPNGNVGIGTTSPGAKLEVDGIIRASDGFRPETNDWEIARDGEDLVIREPEQSKEWARFNDDVSLHLSGTPNLWVDGSIGIGTTSPAEKLHVVGNRIRLEKAGKTLELRADGSAVDVQSTTSDLYIRSGANDVVVNPGGDGKVGIGTANPSEKLHVRGNICATGNIGTCSDLRYKKDFTPLSDALNKVLAMRGTRYQWKQEDYPENGFQEGMQIGFVGQEIEAIYPEVVSTDSEGYKYLDYSRLTPVLVEAIKEQQQLIEQQKASLDKINEKLERMTKANNI